MAYELELYLFALSSSTILSIMPITVAIADDHCLFIEGMQRILASYSEIEVIITVNDGQALLEAVHEREPDVILLDLNMPNMDGVVATKLLKEQYPDVGIILLTLHDNERLISHLMTLGANGYLLKNESPDNVVAAIKSVQETGYHFTKMVGKALLTNVKNNQFNKALDLSAIGKVEFSRRELEVLQLICEQYTTNEIAEKLFITPRTVEGHRKSLLIKSGTRNVAGLVVYALKKQLVNSSSLRL